MQKTKTILSALTLAISSMAALPAFAGGDLEFDVPGADINFCGGGEGGNYYRVIGRTLQEQLEDHTMGRATTEGTPDILSNIADGSCDVGAVQADGLVGTSGEFEVMGPVYDEYVHLVCSAASGIKGVRSLHENPDITIAFTSRKSGGYTTWKAMGELDEGYNSENGPSLTLTTWARLPSKMRNGSIDCFMHVTSLGDSNIINLANNTDGEARLVKFNDYDFNDAKLPNGERLYEFEDIPGKTYANFKKGRRAVETIKVKATLVANARWMAENDDRADDLYGAFEFGKGQMRRAVED